MRRLDMPNEVLHIHPHTDETVGVATSDKLSVVKVWDVPDSEKVAAFFSAAPEMYRALKRVDAFFRDNYTDEDMTFWPLIRNALAKADGKQP